MGKKTSDDHRADAERCLTDAEGTKGDSEAVRDNLQRAQVHALLALSLAMEEHDRFPPGSIE